MQVNVEELGACKVALTIEIEHEAYKDAVAKATDQLLKSISVPGFRKGRAPKQLALRYLNEDAIRKRVVANLVPDAVEAALTQTGLDAYDVLDLNEHQFPQNDEPFRFRAIVITRPKVELAEYKGLRYEVPMVDVDDEAVEKELRSTIGEEPRLVHVDRPAQKGDWVSLTAINRKAEVLDRVGMADPDGGPIGSLLVGAKPGDVLRLRFGDSPTERGEDYVVVAVQSWVTPELTDEYVSQHLGVESVEKLREQVRATLRERAQALWQAEAGDEIVHDVVQRSTVQFPDEMLDKLVRRRFSNAIRRIEDMGETLDRYLLRQGRTLREFEENIRNAAARDFKTFLVLDAIASKEGISEESSDQSDGDGDEASATLTERVISFLIANNEVVPIVKAHSPAAEEHTEGESEPPAAQESEEHPKQEAELPTASEAG